MGRRPIEDKRKQFNRYVAGATGPLVKNLAERLGLSEGEVIDRAIQMLDIAESSEYVPELPASPKTAKPSRGVIKTVDKVADDVQSGDPIKVVSKTEAVKVKFEPPTNTRFQRRT